MATDYKEAKIKECLDFLRAEYRGDLYLTARALLGFDKINEDNRPLCNWIQSRVDPNNLKRGFYLIQMPRETYKTTICSIVFSIWLLMNNPNLSIMIGSAVQKNCIRWLSVIKRKITGQFFRRLFGDWESRDDWRDQDIIISKRDVVKTESSIDCVSVGMSITSKHPDIIILDDIVTAEDRDSPAKREATIKFLDEILDLLNKENGVLFVIGTPWHIDDLFSYITRVLNPILKAENLQQFEIFKSPAISKSGYLNFPNILSNSKLKQIRFMKTDISVYSANYLLEPMNPSTRIFKRDDFGFFEYSEDAIRNSIKHIVIFCDPSLGESTSGDPSAIIVLGKSESGKLAALEADIMIRKPSKIITDFIFLFSIYKNYEKPIFCYMEQNGFQVLLKDDLSKKALEKDMRIPIKGIKNSENKTSRIASLERLTTSKLLLFREDWETAPRNYKQLIYQLESFPQGHDDGPDALEGAIKQIERGGASVRFI